MLHDCITNSNVSVLFLQLKNNIAALYSSRPRGTKSFQKGGVDFGWQPIFDQYERDQERVGQNLARRVPGLRYSFVHRDNWTRLNVLPAKIMQVLKFICFFFFFFLGLTVRHIKWLHGCLFISLLTL